MTTETDIIISDCIDYVRFTASRNSDIDKLLPNMPSLARTGEIFDYGYYGYNRSSPLHGGGRIMWHTEDRAMKYCVELSGLPLAELRRDGFQVEDIFEWRIHARLEDFGYKRVDYALDVENGGAQVKDVWTAWEKKKLKTPARTSRFIRSSDSEYNADTVELGSRESTPRFVRVYDKAAQMKQLWRSLVRIELEMKKGRVDGFVQSVLRHGRSAAGRREIGEMMVTKIGWVNAALAGELAPHMDAPRPDGKPNEFVWKILIPFINNHSEELAQDTKIALLKAVEDKITLA
jgi:hypothetical protein